ncbi:MHS family MFS transporter [Amycolatopsis acidicola]|uniref:MHS family MFS transporter n=1 Tax=Amycolatopsis acidicola TaxID=2596893 RepID=A0A5N0V3A7_9PSEU|nr:MFS transporter [Amycolatopsis acidicola]KAA9159412.1 MHS family MFS transporter [Amycolatopsis acidicola]
MHPTGTSLRRVAVATFTGTLIELYDFVIYATAAALVFPHLFFPALGSSAGTVASFATLGVAFVFRPIGGVLFGHIGDRLGRKSTLVATLLIMGVATACIGLLPPASRIGVAAPILLILLRLVQGIAAGGEWAGATLFAVEHAPAHKRGFWAMFPQIGGTFALALANATFLVTSVGMSNAAFLAYGWRIPFLISFLLVGIGLWVRLRIEETPSFTRQQRDAGSPALPFFEACRHQPREIIFAAGTGLMFFAFFYIGATYLASYATTTMHLSRIFVLTVGIAGGIAMPIGIVIGSALSDRWGRRPVIGTANAIAALWALAIAPLLTGGTGAAFAATICVTMLIAGIAYGPTGAFLPELFRTRYRYTGAGLAYNLAALFGAGIAPLAATSISSSFGLAGVGIFAAALCVVSTASTFALRETRHETLDPATAPRGSRQLTRLEDP